MADNKLSTPVMVVAVVIVVAFVTLTIYLLYMLSSSPNETLWGRLIYLYGGIEALAFAAAGYLFGREVHRQEAENAEKRADQQSKEATDATRKGQRLAASVIAKSRAQSEILQATSVGEGEPTPSAGGDLSSLERLACKLYPDLATN